MARRPSDRQRLERLLAQYDREIAAAFLAAFDRAASAVDRAAVEAALRAGDVGRAVALLQMRDELLAPLAEAIRSAYVAGGTAITAAIPASRAVIGFDGRHPRAERWVGEHVGGLIREIVADQRQMVQAVTLGQIEAGRNPRAVITQIVGRVGPGGTREGGVLGLTTRQAEYVTNARAQLASLDAGYFDRARRDRRFDGLVRRAIAEDRPLSQTDIDRIARRYEARLQGYRGEVIARTESITALRAGRHEGIAQGIEQGAFTAEQVTRVWDSSGDARTRPDHEAMNGVTVHGIDEPFVLPDGSRMLYPGDTSMGAAPEQTVNCRCLERFKLAFIDR